MSYRGLSVSKHHGIPGYFTMVYNFTMASSHMGGLAILVDIDGHRTWRHVKRAGSDFD